MSLHKFILAVIFVFFSSQFLLAGQITLQNGDRLSGVIEKSDDKSLVIKTDYAGEVSVQLSAIRAIESDQPLHVGLKDGQTVVGLVKTTDDKLEVVPASGAAVEVSTGTIKQIRNDEEEAAEQKLEHAGWLQAWTGGVSTSFAMTRGNSETKNLGLAFTADRKTLHDHLGLYATSVLATNDAFGADPSTTANSNQGGARYDHNFGTRTFGFGGADFQTDELQALDLRSVFGGGIGVHLIKRNRTTLDLLGGLNYTRESYSTIQRNFVALTLGEEFMKKIGSGTVLTQKPVCLPRPE